MANNCASISAVSFDVCSTSIGGIKKVWLANYVDDAVATEGESGATKGVITAFASGITWNEFAFRKNTGSMTSTLNVSDEGGNYVSTELALVFSRMDTDKRLAMNALMLADVMAVVEDCNGVRWFLGKNNPLAASAGTGETGTAKADANKYSITLTDESLEFPQEVSREIDLV